MTTFSAHFFCACHQRCILLLMIFSYLGPQAISQANAWSSITAMWMRSQGLGTPLTKGGIFCKNHFDPHISNVLVQSSPARRPAWRQHNKVLTLIVPRIHNVKNKMHSNCFRWMPSVWRGDCSWRGIVLVQLP